jgi:superfamily II DNA/RNA helicase
MSPKQLKLYNEMEEVAMIELEDTFIEAATPAVAVLRCRQIMQSPEMFDCPHGDDGKDAHLINHIQTAMDTGHPLIIFETTKNAQIRINKMAQSMGARSVVLNGDTSSSNRGKYDLMMRSGELDVLVAAPLVAGVGFNWSNVDTMVFSAIDYGDDTFIQNYRRALRGKRETPLKIYLLQYRKSIDQRIAAIVNQKSQDRMLVMGENDTSVHITRKSVDGVIGKE